MIDGEEVGDDQASKALEALAVYRSATEAKVGKIPSLKQLTADIGDIDSEFLKWVASTSGH